VGSPVVKPSFRRIYIDLPYDLSLQFKAWCAKNGTSQNALMRDLITAHMKGKKV